MKGMQILENQAITKEWCFWSTSESIQNDLPCVTAIIETLLAVPLYWLISLKVGMIQPLLVAAAIAPLVLLRSEESVALGIRWYLRFEKIITTYKRYENLELPVRRGIWVITALYSVLTVLLTSFLIWN